MTRCGQFFEANTPMEFRCGRPLGHEGEHGECDQRVLRAARAIAAERIPLDAIRGEPGIWPREVPIGTRTSHGTVLARVYQLRREDGTEHMVAADELEAAIYDGDGRRLIVVLKRGAP